MSEQPLRFSLISPTFGRPEEVTEFLESILKLKHPSFEVILADGTPGDALRPVLQPWVQRGEGKVRILYEEFLPVSDARNLAAGEAKGQYLIFLDSDCIIPEDYLSRVEKALEGTPADLFGGPDAAGDDFTPLQKAISYSMTSIITTGGIRGAKNASTSYQPRGFNMGIRKAAFEAVHGYDESLKCGEDVDLSLRLQEHGFASRYFPGAKVYHKRRTSLKKFFKQVYRFGAARIDLAKRHKGQMKLTHLFPLGFSLFALLAIALVPIGVYLPVWFLFTYTLAIFLHSSVIHKSPALGGLSVVTSFTMFFGYGWGLLRNGWSQLVKGRSVEL
mgnify:CR=1 FL=1